MTARSEAQLHRLAATESADWPPATGKTEHGTMTDDRLQTLTQALAMRDRQIDAVHRISAALFSKTDLDSLLGEALHVSLETVEADAGSIWLYDSDRRKLICRNVYGGKEELVGFEIDPEKPDAKAAAVFRTGKPTITDTTTEVYDSTADQTYGYQTNKLLTIPLKNLGGETIGVLQILNKRFGQFDEDDQELMEIVASLAATSIVNVRLAEEAQLAAVARAVGDLGHDIKNALTPIETMVDTTVASFIAPMYAELDRLLPCWRETNPEIAGEIAAATEALRDWYPEVLTSVKDGCADIRELVSEIADYVKGAQSTNIEVGDIG